jgi:hypothetical protein
MQEECTAVPLRAAIEPIHNMAAKFVVNSRDMPKDGFVEDIVQGLTDARFLGRVFATQSGHA